MTSLSFKLGIVIIVSVIVQETLLYQWTTDKVCIGTSLQLRREQLDSHYAALKKRYENCTYVDGNLELTYIDGPERDLSFLKDIREVTGYVLIAFVYAEEVPLDSLQIIRGQTLFVQHLAGVNGATVPPLALKVVLNFDTSRRRGLKYLRMPKMAEILQGGVQFVDNRFLCHLEHDIVWDDIVSPGAHVSFDNSYNEFCTKCDAKCNGHCWYPGECQKLCRENCSPQCNDGRCFGSGALDCCSDSCAVGCTGPEVGHCMACKHFNNSGTCLQACPPLTYYDYTTYKVVSNPDGKYSFGSLCVSECPPHLLKNRTHGACVKSCSRDNMANDDNECVPCKGPCPKTCEGTTIHKPVNSKNVAEFEGCTIIDGEINIIAASFSGDYDFDAGDPIPPLNVSDLEYLSAVKEVTGCVNIEGSADLSMDSFPYLRNLEKIHGRSLYQSKMALSVSHLPIKALELTSLKQVVAGSVFITNNTNLCYVDTINWTRLANPTQQISLKYNRAQTSCEEDGHVCNQECSSDGCWGSGSDQCQFCSNFKLLDGTCVRNCDNIPGVYPGKNSTCQPCHEQCDNKCIGPDANHCHECRFAISGEYCVEKCPRDQYRDEKTKRCMKCHQSCVDGCSGPANFPGEGGCTSCNVTVMKDKNTFDHCLVAPRSQKDPCPRGYYDTSVSQATEIEILRPLVGNTICYLCDPLCQECDGEGVFSCPQCTYFKDMTIGTRDGKCVAQCNNKTTYVTHSNECRPCSSLCKDGCVGPSPFNCTNCKDYRIILDKETKLYNCAAECPADIKLIRVEGPNLVCTDTKVGPNKPLILGIFVPVVVLLLIVCAVLIFYYRRKYVVSEKKAQQFVTDRFRGGEDIEPLTPTNTAPNTELMRTIKDQELHKGKVLGSGAFGTVYRGVWTPEGDEVY